MIYSVTIHITNRGTRLKERGTSCVGHMWYEITDYKSKPKSYRFSPVEQGKAIGIGRIYYDHSDNHQSTSYSRTTIEITKEQYEELAAMKLPMDKPIPWETFNLLPISFTVNLPIILSRLQSKCRQPI